jgi:hypothetical protein
VLVVLGDQIRPEPDPGDGGRRARTRGWSRCAASSLRQSADVRCMQAVLGFLGC